MMKQKITRISESELWFEDLDNAGNNRAMSNDEVRTGSITPTTFKSREFEEDTSDQWFIDNYEYNGNKVVRFGINTYTLTLDKINLDGFENIESKSELVSSNIRSGSSGSTNYKAIAESIVHTPIERTVVRNAVNYLLGNHEEKVVLIDILARDQHTIQMDGPYPESHTLVLYKNPVINGKHEILVIDPSNFIFSSHLCNADIVPLHDLLDKITVLHKKDIQIYLPQGEVGRGNNQYRDCVDLSAKIAFGLNKMDNWSKLDLKEIKDWDVITELSNNRKIDSSIIALDLPIRIKQTSDTNTIRKFNMIEKSINNILKIVSSHSSEMQLSLKNDFCFLLENNSSLDSLASHYEVCMNRLYLDLQEQNVVLLGFIGGEHDF